MGGLACAWLVLLAASLAAAESLPAAPRLRWGQTNEKLFITFLLRPVPAEETLRVAFNASHVHLTGQGLDALVALREDVVPEASTWSTTRDGVKATLLKQAPHRFDTLVSAFHFWVLLVSAAQTGTQPPPSLADPSPVDLPDPPRRLPGPPGQRGPAERAG